MFDGNNQQYYGQQGGFNQFNGFNSAQVQPIKNALTDEQIKQLQQNSNAFSLSITERDVLRAKCTHRQPDGLHDSLTLDENTGIARCLICGYEFRPIDPSVSLDSIADSIASVIDILQTIKLLFPTIPADAVGEYFQIIPLLEKAPEFFKLAVKESLKYDTNAWTYGNNNMGGAAMFANLLNSFGGFMPNQQPMQQPQFMNAPMMGQPVVPQQQPVMPGGNPFGFPGASQQPQVYQPTTTPGYSFSPNVTTAAAPAQPAQATDTITTTVEA